MAYHKLLGANGYTVLKSKLSAEEQRDVRSDCTVTTTVLPAFRDFQKPKKYKLFYQDEDCIYVPRYYGVERFGEPDYMAMPEGRPMHGDVRCKFEPLAHQGVAIGKLLALLDPSKEVGDGGVLSIPCGYGKTFCAIYGACKLGLCTLVVVTTERLQKQFVDAIKTFAPTARVGTIRGSKVDVEGKDFVVAMLHSLAQRKYPRKVFDRFGLTVFDECHHLSSEMFCKSMMRIRTRFTLGLSATPYRQDGLSEVFFKFLGPLFHSEKRSGSNKVIVKKLVLSSNHESFAVKLMANGTKNTSGMVTALAQYDERNAVILESLKLLLQHGRRILLISCRKSQLRDIKDMIDAAELRTATGTVATAGLYFGMDQSMRGDIREQSREANLRVKDYYETLLEESAKCDIVLGIDKLAKEGLDIPDRDTLVWATPPGIAVEQPVGRILRRYHTHVNPMVIDLVDGTGNFPKHSAERDKWFRDEDYDLHVTRYELLGVPEGENWKERLFVALNTDKTESKRTVARRKKEKEATEAPDLDMCVLGDEKGSMPRKPKHAATAAVAKTVRRARKEPCLVARSTAVVDPTQFGPPAKASRDEPLDCLI